MTCDQAKVCSNDRLTLEGALNNAREDAARGVAAGAGQPVGVLRVPVAADSDAGNDQPDATAPCTPFPRPQAVTNAERVARKDADTSAATEDMPLIVFPSCVEQGCSTEGNLAMVSCTISEGDLHRQCGTTMDDYGKECQERRCTACASRKNGMRKSRS